jgi:hypothetical protein
MGMKKRLGTHLEVDEDAKDQCISSAVELECSGKGDQKG